MPKPRSHTSDRITIKLPPWHLRLLQLWAQAKGMSATTLTQNIVQARIEANEPQIKRMTGEGDAIPTEDEY